MNRQRRRVAAALGLAGLMARPGRAAPAFPQGPVRIRSAYPPGGVSDALVRALAQRLSARWSVPVWVDHLPGAGGTLAMAWLATAPADGHALVFSATSPLTLSPHLVPLRFRPQLDVAPLLALARVPLLVVGTPALAQRRLDEALRAGGVLRWATAGIATTGHLALEAVRLASGRPIVHVPYKGGGQPIQDALAGRFELLSTNAAPAQLALVREGRLHALAVGAEAPLEALPQVPTLAQAGFAEANLSSVFGLFAPGATPAPRLALLAAELQAARDAASPAERAASDAGGALPPDRAGFAQLLATERLQRARLVQRLGSALLGATG